MSPNQKAVYILAILQTLTPAELDFVLKVLRGMERLKLVPYGR